jgi:hypothetical protein
VQPDPVHVDEAVGERTVHKDLLAGITQMKVDLGVRNLARPS